jgi:hypothetical protein
VISLDLARDLGTDATGSLTSRIVRHRLQGQRIAQALRVEVGLSLEGADLRGVDLVDLDLSRAHLDSVVWDASTRWPTAEFADRMRRTSVEIHPGVWQVQPEASTDHTPSGVPSPV